MVAVILLSLAAYAVETLPGLTPPRRRLLRAVEAACTLWFMLEYALRLWVAKPRLGYAFSFFGVIDLLAALPLFLVGGINLQTLRALRALRLLQLFRVFKLARYHRAGDRFRRALLIAREEVVLFAVAICILLFLAAAGIHWFEHEAQPEAYASIFHSLWWAIVTLTTVGYGDVYPVTAGGRVFTFCVLLIGLGVVSVPAGLVSSALARADEAIERDRKHKRDRKG